MKTKQARPHFVRMFKPRFAELVEAGTKLQTVRPRPKRLPHAGDTISLRCWTGLPYRSKQAIIREAEIAAVHDIILENTGITIWAGNNMIEPPVDAFARSDGFTDWPEMRAWFEHEHGLPFTGIVIHWR